MSWNGTVYCGHCGEKGHNRRGCPKLKEQMAARLSENPDDYWAKNYFEKKKGAKVRKCGFCGEQGHNKATCPRKKEVIKQFSKANLHYQEQVARLFEQQGVKVGALVTMDQLYTSKGYVNDVIGIVTDIDWDKIHLWGQNSDAPRCLSVRFTGATNKTAQLAPKISNDGATFDWASHSSYCVPVVSPGSGSIGHRRLDGLLSKPVMKELLDDDRYQSRYDYDAREYRAVSEMGMKCENYWKNVKASEASLEESA